MTLYESNAAVGAVISTLPVTFGPGGPQAGKLEPFLETTATFPSPTFSPDGHWMAYALANSGNYEVYVRAFPDGGAQRQISNKGGNFPNWSPNGRELFYRTEDQRIMVVNYSVKEGAFVAEKPKLWSGRQLANLGLTANLDLARDGKRFVVVLPAEEPEPRDSQSHVTVVVNFIDELRRRAAMQGK
jgi:serine/threonine-protein kinase